MTKRKGHTLTKETTMPISPLSETNTDILPADVFSCILSYLDTATLIAKKGVCTEWRDICTAVVTAKAPTPKQVFQSKMELHETRVKYRCRCLENPELAEDIASTYGWPIGRWDVSNITNLSYLFIFDQTFNEDIGDWDVSNATDMSYMFNNAEIFNQDIGRWDVSNVTKMTGMFSAARAFNQDISKWNVSRVTRMNCMFQLAHSFNQDVGRWDMSKVTNISQMFRNASSFNHDISKWNVMKVAERHSVFIGASSFDCCHYSPWKCSHPNRQGKST